MYQMHHGDQRVGLEQRRKPADQVHRLPRTRISGVGVFLADMRSWLKDCLRVGSGRLLEPGLRPKHDPRGALTFNRVAVSLAPTPSDLPKV